MASQLWLTFVKQDGEVFIHPPVKAASRREARRKAKQVVVTFWAAVIRDDYATLGRACEGEIRAEQEAAAAILQCGRVYVRPFQLCSRAERLEARAMAERLREYETAAAS